MKVKPGAVKRFMVMLLLFPIWGPIPFVIGTRLAAFCFHAINATPVHIVEQRAGAVVWLVITCILVRLIVFKTAKPQPEQAQVQPHFG